MSMNPQQLLNKCRDLVKENEALKRDLEKRDGITPCPLEGHPAFGCPCVKKEELPKKQITSKLVPLVDLIDLEKSSPVSNYIRDNRTWIFKRPVTCTFVFCNDGGIYSRFYVKFWLDDVKVREVSVQAGQIHSNVHVCTCTFDKMVFVRSREDARLKVNSRSITVEKIHFDPEPDFPCLMDYPSPNIWVHEKN